MREKTNKNRLLLVVTVLVLMGVIVIMYQQTNHSKISTFIQKSNGNVSMEDRSSIANAVQLFAHKHKVPLQIVIGVLRQESNFRKEAISNAGAYGIAQIMPEVWGNELTKKGIISSVVDLFNIYNAIDASCYILAKYKKQFKTWDKAVQAYYGWNKEYTKGYSISVFRHGAEFELIRKDKA